MSNTLKFGNGEWYGKEGTILAYNSENNNYKPLPFTFDRDSVATRVNKQGLIETVGADQPRIDYLNDSNGALLLEPSRTNLFSYSEDFNTWSRSGWTLTSGLLAPNGSLDAYSVLRTTGSTFAQSTTLLSNTTYTFSAYIKNVNATNIQLRVQNQAGNTIGTESNCIVFSVTDQTNDSGFTRITHTFNTGDAGTYGLFLGYYSAGEYIVWGAQIEQGSYPTSYIPTQGGSAVTRLADSCYNGGNEQVFNDSEGVLYFETKGLVDVPINSGHIKLSKSGEASFNNSLTIQHRNNGYLRVWVNGTATANIHFNVNIDFTENHKIAVLYKLNGYKLFIDGVSQSLYGTPTQTVFSGLDNLSFDNRGVGNWNGSIKDVRVYNTILSDAELVALTS